MTWDGQGFFATRTVSMRSNDGRQSSAVEAAAATYFAVPVSRRPALRPREAALDLGQQTQLQLHARAWTFRSKLRCAVVEQTS
jgi:hypothetical protein